MSVSYTLQQYLMKKGVVYDVLRHSPTWSSSQTAQVSHVSGKNIAKGVVLKDESGFLLAVLPASYHIHFNRLKNLLHRDMDLASEKETEFLFRDCERGAIPAIGDAFGMEVIVDESLTERPDVFFEGGDHVCLLHMKADQFDHLMNTAQHGNFSHPA